MIRKHLLTIAFIIASLSLIASASLLPQAPERFATHWNAEGIADGFSSPVFGLLLLPALSFVILGLYSLFRRIDPLKQNIAASRPAADGLMLALVLFFTYLQTMTVYWNIVGPFSFNRVIAPAFGALFFIVGLVMRRTKRNWFIGIRTPWTLSSDAVWERTHALGGTLFMFVGGFSAVLGILLPQLFIWLLLFPIIGVTVFLFFYSYLLYRKEKNGSDRQN